jgi:transmembrane sensor
MSGEKERPELPRLKLDWDAGRTERLLASVHIRLHRRKRAWRAAALSATLASVVCVVAVVALRSNRVPMSASSSSDAPTDLAPRNPASRSTIHLADGSEIEVDPATSEIRVIEESAARVRVEVVRGTSRYSVVPNPDRTFDVHCGPVTVTVVGTEFVVERRAETTWVEVLHGKVKVSWSDDHAFLVAGESGTFPRGIAPNVAEDGVTGRDEVDAKAARGPHATQVYRSRVARRDYRGAYAVLSRNPALAGDTVEELLVAADVARLSNHPSEAVPYLQRIIREHPRDERAPLAAFTLGRTLGGLGRTEEAMNMFGRVRSVWPKSPLAEDALLRQAEAASQLGDFVAARRLAEQYDRDYPNGRRRSEVRRYARLE